MPRDREVEDQCNLFYFAGGSISWKTLSIKFEMYIAHDSAFLLTV